VTQSPDAQNISAIKHQQLKEGSALNIMALITLEPNATPNKDAPTSYPLRDPAARIKASMESQNCQEKEPTKIRIAYLAKCKKLIVLLMPSEPVALATQTVMLA
jgi:hypothetical protein